MNTPEWLELLDSMGYFTLRIMLSTLWQSSILLGGVGLLAYILRRRKASIRYILWAAAVLVIPVLPLLTYGIAKVGTPQRELAVIPAYETKHVDIKEPPIPQKYRSDVIEEARETNNEVILPPQDIPAFFPQAGNNLSENRLTAIIDYPWACLFIGYLIGVSFFIIWIFIGRLRIRNWILHGIPVMDQTVVELFLQAAQRLGLRREFIIIENDHVPAPMTCRVFRPVIIMPAGFMNTMSRKELETVGVHELSHVNRYDVIVFAVLSFIKTVFFIHPLVWMAVRRVSHLAELACDAEVIESTNETIIYADMLTRLAEHLPYRALTTELAAGIIFSKSSFFRRIEAILSDRKEQIKKLSRIALMGTVGAVVLSLVIALILPLGYARERGETVTISGKVMYKGEPIKGAEIYFNDVRIKKVEKVTVADRKGLFSFEIEKSKIFDDQWSRPAVIAYSSLYPLGWINLTRASKTNDITININKSATISGSVEDASGNPVNDVKVAVNGLFTYTESGLKMIQIDDTIIQSLKSKTGKEGKFLLNNIPSGYTCSLTAVKKGYAREIIHLRQTNADNVEITLKPESRIEGEITYRHNGKPAKNVKVIAKRTGMPKRDVETKTNKNGIYIFTGLISDNYNIYAVPDGELPEWTAEKRENIIVKEGETIKNVDFILIKGGIISGKVVDKDTGEPIPDHYVSLHDYTLDDYHTPVQTIFTDVNGLFSFQAAPGTVRLMTYKPDGYLQPEWWKQGPAVDDFRIKVDVEVVEGKTITVDRFQFKKSPIIRGFVHSKDGQPVSGVTITHGESFARKDTKTGEDGAFIISDYKTGEEVSLSAINEELKLRGNLDIVVKPDAKADIILENFETTGISGRVIDFESNPIYNANVDLGWSGRVITTISTDGNGLYSFDGLILGDEYWILAQAEGYNIDKRITGKEFITDKHMSHYNDIVLHKADRWMEGNVTDQNGNPVSGALIFSKGRSRTTTNAAGYFRIEEIFGVAVGEISIEHKDYGKFDFQYVPTNQHHHFTLVKGNNTFSGRVVDTKGNPIKGAFITIDPIWHSTGKYRRPFETEYDGKLEYDNMIEEYINLTIYIPSHGEKKYEHVNAQENIELVFDKADERKDDEWDFNNKGVVILEGKPAPSLQVGSWISGNSVTLGNCKSKVVVLDFMTKETSRNGTGGYTYEKTRFINALQREYKDKGVVVIGIHEHTSDVEAVKKLIHEKGLSYSIAIDTESKHPGSSGLTFETYGISKYNDNIIIDRNGIVHTDIQNIELKIRELLNQGS